MPILTNLRVRETTEDNILGPRGGRADLSLFGTLLALCQESRSQDFGKL